MTKHTDTPTSRRDALRFLVGAVGVAASLPLLKWPVTAAAGTLPTPGTVAKSALQYQDHPKGTSFCANCANFIPPPKPGMAGHCTIVAGDIKSKGWCLAYAAKG